MRIAIMQPYFLPYVGYFQLMAAVDKFVILDDVNYIKGGWINRNRILANGQAQYFTVPVAGASPNRQIADISISTEGDWKRKSARRCEEAYRKAPFFDQGNSTLEQILNADEIRLSSFLVKSLVQVTAGLEINTYIVPTSRVYPKGELRGAERVLDICSREKATEYINLPGGTELYDHQKFAERGISLKFLKPTIVPYPQGSDDFIPCLSILDVLMWNSIDEVQRQVHSVVLEEQ